MEKKMKKGLSISGSYIWQWFVNVSQVSPQNTSTVGIFWPCVSECALIFAPQGKTEGNDVPTVSCY